MMHFLQPYSCPPPQAGEGFPLVIPVIIVAGIVGLIIAMQIQKNNSKRLKQQREQKQQMAMQNNPQSPSMSTSTPAPASSRPANYQHKRPDISVDYRGSGIRTLRALGWVCIAIFVILLALWASQAADSGFGFLLWGISALIWLPIVAIFSGICFALATIAENALMSKAVLESKYDFREGDGGGYTTILDVEREAKAKYVAGKFSGECLPRDPKTRNN